MCTTGSLAQLGPTRDRPARSPGECAAQLLAVPDRPVSRATAARPRRGPRGWQGADAHGGRMERRDLRTARLGGGGPAGRRAVRQESHVRALERVAAAVSPHRGQ